MSNHKQETCEERIEGQLESCLADLRKLWEAYGDDEEGDESFHDYGLSFDYVEPDEESRQGYFRYQISWGGPSSEYRFYVNPDFSAHKVEYWFLDWFDGASRTLSGADEILLIEIFDWFKDCGSVEQVFNDATG